MMTTQTVQAGWMRLGEAAAGVSRLLSAVSRRCIRPCSARFAQTGGPPETSLLEDAAAPFDAAQALAELADRDFLCLDDAGRITAAYPFSALPTAHRVQIAGASAYAMCAIDALGIAPMVDSKAVIQSADPSTGQPITVTVDGSNSEWHPGTAVVFAGRTGSEAGSGITAVAVLAGRCPRAPVLVWPAGHGRAGRLAGCPARRGEVMAGCGRAG